VVPGQDSRAARRWWDGEAAAYQEEHGGFLGPQRFVWGPEGLTEEAAGLLGAVAGLCVLEVGCGAAQCAAWLAARGATVVALDVSAAQLRHARRQAGVGLVQADALALPLRDARVDLACSAYGAVPFVADLVALHTEVARVLRPGGRWVFSTTHPLRWCFPDDPTEEGLRATHPYFDRTPYTEVDEHGQLTYAEFHATLGDHLEALRAGGFTLEALVEPPWPPDNAQVWGGWSPLRGRLLPGTLILAARREG